MPEGFGQAVAVTGNAVAYGFAATSGYRDDGDAGLFHVGARYYDAQVAAGDTIAAFPPP